MRQQGPWQTRCLCPDCGAQQPLHHLLLLRCPAAPGCSALPAKLDKLRLEVHETPSELMDTVAHHLQPSVLSLLACAPSQSMWLPQLQRCAVQFHTNDQLELLEAGLEHVAGLRALHVSDERPLPVRIAEPPELLALEDLPQLRSLVSWLRAGSSEGRGGQ